MKYGLLRATHSGKLYLLALWELRQVNPAFALLE